MHDVQDEVRALLQERSGDIGFDPRIPARVLRRSRRRQVLTVGGAGLGAAALALVVLAGLRAFSISDDKAPATETPPEPTPAVEVPSTFVGFADDAVVVASTETGEVLSTIAGPEVVGSRVHGADFFTTALALAPDRTAAYFSAFEPRGAGRRLMLAPLDGGEPEDLGPGWDPLPSPDGGRLAYVACAPDGCGGALVIRDLGTGAETRVPMGSSDMLLTPAGGFRTVGSP